MASSKHMLSREEVPMWLWAEEFADPESFIDLPPDFSWDSLPVETMPVVEAKEPTQNKPIFYYSRITTQHCIDSELLFCEGLAIAYSRILEDKSEKIFLRGNTFLAKLAKAVFEQNGNLFAETCGKYKDEKYFRECAEELGKLGFNIEKDKKVDKKSWLGLYEIVLLLAEEYVATKCKLPKAGAIECKENSNNAENLEIIFAPQNASEESIKEAAIVPLKLENDRLYDSSDYITAGELFHEFLNKNFPFKDNETELSYFMKGIYGEEACADLGWFCKAAADGTLPHARIEIDAMEGENVLGGYEGDVVYINQRLVLDALRNPDAHFVLFLAMLIEYGNFLGNALQEKAGIEGGNHKLVGRNFAYRFMECSEADLFNSDFEFADFSSRAILASLEDNGNEQKFTVGVSGLSCEQRKRVFYTLDSLNIWEEGD